MKCLLKNRRLHHIKLCIQNVFKKENKYINNYKYAKYNLMIYHTYTVC